MISNLLSRKNNSFPNSSASEGLLDVADLVTGGREGIICYKVTGTSDVEHIKPGYYVFIDPFQQPVDGEAVVEKICGKNFVRVYKREQKRLTLVGSKDFQNPYSRISGVVISHLAVY